ncbi:hypothetical protein [Persephonella sp.]
MDWFIGFLVLFPVIVIVSIIAVFFLPESLSKVVVLITGVYVSAISRELGKNVKKTLKEKFFRK